MNDSEGQSIAVKTASRLHTAGRAGLFFFLPLLTLGWTSLPGASRYTLHLALIVLIVAITAIFVKGPSPRLQLTKTVIHTLLILLLVGGTGWFLSPFFFLLYLLPIYLGFLYAPAVAFGFLAALLIIFAFSIGEVDLAFDLMTLLSLLLAVPLIIYLRKKFLVLRQTARDILILENESGIKDANTISRLLANRVTSLGVNMRQPLTFIKQAATLLLQEDIDPKEATKQLRRIRTTALEALEQVRSFEDETSANLVLRKSNHTPKT